MSRKPGRGSSWPKEPLAIFGQPFHIVPLNEGVRFRLWAELSTGTNDKKNMREAV